MMTARIAGIGAYVPENLITNDDLAKIVDTNDEWIRTRTGIRERRISSGEGTRHLAAKAAERALAAAGVAPEELDIIILGTSSPDRNYPSDACSVQAAIGAVNAVAFDISAACAGFIFAMNIVEGFFKAGIYKTALIIGAETLSKVTDWSDRGTCVLFGDGAGAAVLKAEETGIIDMMMGADGTKGDVLACTSRTVGNFLTGTKPELGFMTMDGQEVFKFAVRKVPESVMELLQRTGTKKEDIKYYVLHQANERIIEAAARRLKEPMEKFPMTIGQFGNTSTASIPLLLDDMIRKDMLKRGDKIIMSGFGAGMTWGAVLIRKAGEVIYIIRNNLKKQKNAKTHKIQIIRTFKGDQIMLEKMKEIIAEQLSTDADSITEATSFKDDLGADSLDLFELVMALEDEYSVEIPAEDLQNLATVGDVMKYLKDKGVEE